jgi:hypothetical protein
MTAEPIQLCNDCRGELNLLGRCHCPIPKHGTHPKPVRFQCRKYREDDFGGLTHKVIDTDPEIAGTSAAVVDETLTPEDAADLAAACNSLDAKDGMKL